jgi:hypothetical protein
VRARLTEGHFYSISLQANLGEGIPPTGRAEEAQSEEKDRLRANRGGVELVAKILGVDTLKVLGVAVENLMSKK